MPAKKRAKHDVAQPEGQVVDVGDLIRDVAEPDQGPVTEDDVKILRRDPELAEIAEIAERYARRSKRSTRISN